VGCKRDPNCPFVIRCNWERKNGREPLARVTVMKDRHTCLNGVEWMDAVTAPVGHGAGVLPNGSVQGNGNPNVMNGVGSNTLEIRQDADGNIVGGARVLGPVEGRGQIDPLHQQVVPVLPKVQRNSASRLPFLMEILPRLMNITKQTTPIEIRECLLREYGAEVHLQQCRRAKTEILKKQAADREERGEMGQMSQITQMTQGQDVRAQQSLDGMGSDGANDSNQQLFGEMNATPSQSPHPFTLHTATGVVTPVISEKSTTALRTVGEAPVRCPYCLNHRWMRSIKDAVEHMSMHVVV
jgi:hypothetical protein